MPTLPSARAARKTLDQSHRSLGSDAFGLRKPGRRRRRRLRWGPGTALKLVALAFLPAVFVRAAVEFYRSGFGTMATIACSAIVVLIALSLLVVALSAPLAGKRARFSAVARWVALPAVLLWVAYSLFYLSQANAKTAGVRDAYTSLHPVLRLAVASAIVADGDLVVTDARRSADDYRRMKLPVFERTLHYPQADSWVHAIDVRTIGHNPIRNVALGWYFRVVGLRVVRHVGTADHLHIELTRR
jgi:hypothetical protein